MNMLCEDAELQALMETIQSGDGREIEHADRLLASYPEDARLHFLRGSILAGIGRSIEAMLALRKAVELAPDFLIARFQLGFFQLTSGEAADALSTWGPLAMLPENHYLRKFVAGLTHLIRDEFADAILHLREGMALNQENPPLNHDMQMLVDQASLLLSDARQRDEERSSASATSVLLGQFADRSGDSR